ncbi:fungal-specific transcription factor domain-domain-containing protein [Aspergillus taichungensis]|uniref:Fungal-specific transcription factor domain-domain-containing protein n=1 Tax=Aspergillus taichungensis TaxID=482145 RepID=A0A2J5HY71_9EURO|nr:fungal-specific transcription factor domain-domain-containing protein [Aspergillus taichungensis]
MDPAQPLRSTRVRASRRRPRASRACETCRVRKTKCDQAQPCSYCDYHSLDCFYRENGSTDSPLKRHAQVKDVQRKRSRPSPWPEADVSHVADNVQQKDTNVQVIESSPRVTPIHDPSNLGGETPELGDSASRDGLSGVNLHTSGTEFYGNSSNLAFLGNLYARARHQADSQVLHVADLPYPPTETTQADIATPTGQSDKQSDGAIPKPQLSIVNLLYNPTYPSHFPPQASGRLDGDRGRESQLGTRDLPRSHVSRDATPRVEELTLEAQIEIEKIFISSYFSNKHYVHPMLNKNNFMQRCEREAFILSHRPRFARGMSRFSGLYFAVVAVGAINASPNETSLLEHYSTTADSSSGETSTAQLSALDFANHYFKMAKHALGDLFEGGCLETVQALSLLGVYCQNALQPHSCFMYSGMAARTAVAIGLTSSMSSLSPNTRREGRRTWWCLYSHEMCVPRPVLYLSMLTLYREMCCSSGRLDSMKDLQYYQVPFPTIKDTPDSQSDSDAEDQDVAIIPVMAALAHIMSEASHQLYHSSKCSMNEKSQIAIDLDRRLLAWKATIPPFLDIDIVALNDPEWAFKQKLVLKLRFYNTRILIHRPFLAGATANTESPVLHQHLHPCLEAARNSIQVQYESFVHRMYFRTWWYNTTYALYGAMILLHIVLSGFPGIDDDALLQEVDKAVEIFESMKNILVARRCAEMIREVSDVARACLARRGAVVPPTQPDFGIQPDVTAVHGDLGQDEFFYSLFNQDAQTDTRAEMLANLVDPTILEDFAFGDSSFVG